MLRILAKIISHLFQPIYITFYSVLMLYFFIPNVFPQPSQMTDSQILLTFFINTLFFPLLTLLLMKALNIIKDIEMYDRMDRYIPLIAMMVFYCWMAVLSFKNEMNYPLQVLAVGGFVVLIMSFVVTIFLKTSLHMAGISSALSYWIFLYTYSKQDLIWLIIALVLCVGIVGSARLYLKAHTLREVIFGTCIGVFGIKIAIIILGYFYAF